MNQIQAITLEELGFNSYHKNEIGDLDLSKYVVARIIAEYKEAYKVRSINKEYLAKITGKQMFLAEKREDYPAVGDFVLIDELPEGKAVIRVRCCPERLCL